MKLRSEQVMIAVLVSTILVLLVTQAASLYVTPIHDSYLWWGDESWLMLEYRTQMTEGVFRHPYAYGSSLFQGNPFVLSSMWLTSLVYGAPAAMLEVASIVDLGRTVTFILAIILAVALYHVVRLTTSDSITALVCVLLLVSARSFFLTSHSARYDIVTALWVLSMVFVLARTIRSGHVNRLPVLATLLPLGLLISVHAVVLTILPLVIAIVWLRTSLTAAVWLRMLLGGAMATLILYSVYVFTQPAVVATSTMANSLYTLPILRPLSRSVQVANLLQKLEALWTYSVVVLPLLALCMVSIRHPDRTWRAVSLLGLSVFVTWVLVEPAGPSSYLIHFLPVLIVGAAGGLRQCLTSSTTRVVCFGLLGLLVVFAWRDARQAHGVGDELSSNLEQAIESIGPLKDTVLALNPAVSHLSKQRVPFMTAHFIELPAQPDMFIPGSHVLTFNSETTPGFIWEVTPLRDMVGSPAVVRIGKFLDVGRSYFEPVGPATDTFFYAPIDQRIR
jgi:hypothetical protein